MKLKTASLPVLAALILPYFCCSTLAQEATETTETTEATEATEIEESRQDCPIEFNVSDLRNESVDPVSILEILGIQGAAADFSEPTALLFITRPDEEILRIAKLLNLAVVTKEKEKARGAVVYLGEPTEKFTKTLLDAYLKIPVTKYAAKPEKTDPETVAGSDLKIYENTTGYRLNLNSVSKLEELSSPDEQCVIVALVGEKLHIRVIDAEGATILDKGEKTIDKGDAVIDKGAKNIDLESSGLVSSPELSDLKKRLTSSPFPKVSDLSEEDQQQIIETALRSAGGILSAYPATVVLWKKQKITDTISLSAKDLTNRTKEKEILEKYLKLFN